MPFKKKVILLEKCIDQYNFVLKNMSYGTIEIATYLSQLIGCMGFDIVLEITPCKQLH